MNLYEHWKTTAKWKFSRKIFLLNQVLALTSLCSLAKRGIEFSSVVIFVIYSFLLETVVSNYCEEKSSTSSKDQSELSFKPTV